MKKNILYNNTIKLYENFIANADDNFNVDKNFKPNLMNNLFGSYNFRTLKLNSNIHFKFYHKWADYYIRHSVEFKLFIRYLKENNIYQKILNNKHHFIYEDNLLNFKFIGEILDWGLTKEGYSYWNKEDNNWNNFFDKIKCIIKYDK